jgi:hypothetical protein
MSKQHRQRGERVQRAEIIFALPPSPQGTHSYERQDGTVVHGDVSGEWTLDETGEIEDIVFFASPRWLRANTVRNEQKDDRGEGQRLAASCSPPHHSCSGSSDHSSWAALCSRPGPITTIVAVGMEVGLPSAPSFRQLRACARVCARNSASSGLHHPYANLGPLGRAGSAASRAPQVLLACTRART